MQNLAMTTATPRTTGATITAGAATGIVKTATTVARGAGVTASTGFTADDIAHISQNKTRPLNGCTTVTPATTVTTAATTSARTAAIKRAGSPLA